MINSLEKLLTAEQKFKCSGTYKVKINIFELNIEFQTDSNELMNHINQQFKNFIPNKRMVKNNKAKDTEGIENNESTEDTINLVLQIFEGQVQLGDNLWRKYNMCAVKDKFLIMGPFYACILNDRCTSGKAFIGENLEELNYLFSFMRALAPVLSRKNRGTLLHSSGIIRDEMAYLFLGDSGAGKTTVIRLSGPCVALSDEAIMVKEIDEGIKCWGSPFGREHPGTNIGARLKACFFLVKDDSTYLERVNSTKGASMLVSNLWGIIEMEDITSEMLEICFKIARSIPCYKMHFQLNNRFLMIIDDELYASGR